MSVTWKQLAFNDDVLGRKKLHGIETAGALSFDNSSHVFTIAGTVTYWISGVKYTTASAITCDIDDYISLTTNTLYWLYFDGSAGTLKAKEATPNFFTDVMVATLYWNGSAARIGQELHNHTRDLDFHLYEHLTEGCRYYSGLGQTTPSTAADSSLQIETGVIRDEDQSFTTGTCTTMVGWFKASSTKYTWLEYALPYLGTTNQPQWLDTDDYTLKDVGANDYVCMWVYATLDPARPIQIVPTHASAAHATLNLAKAETIPTLSGFGLNPEWKLIYKWIFKGNGDYEASGTIDYRTVAGQQYGSVGAVVAGSVTFSPAGNIAATNVQTAIEELDSEKITGTLTSAEQGDILYHNGTTFVNLAHGTDGQYLKTKGHAANPEWGPVSAGGDAAIADQRVWSDTFSVSRTSDTVVTCTSTALVANTIIGRILRWTDSGGTNVRRGFITSATESGGTVTINISGDAFASGDTAFRIGLKGYEAKIKEWYVTGEQIADASNPVGRQDVTPYDISVISFNAYVGTAAAGTSADLKYDIYDDGTGIFTTDPSFTTNVSVLNSLPDRSSNKTLIAAGSRITLRTPTSGGATNKASDLNVLMFYGLDDWWDAV